MIQFRIDKHEEKSLKELAKKQNKTIGEFFMEAMLYYMNNNSDEITKEIRTIVMNKNYFRKLKQQKEHTRMSYHFLNSYQRILILIGKRLNTQTQENNNVYAIVFSEVEKTLDAYHELPKEVKGLLAPEKAVYERLTTPKGIDQWLRENHFRFQKIPFAYKKLIGKRGKQ